MGLDGLLLLRGAKPFGTSPFVTFGLWIVVPPAGAPIVDFVTKGSQCIHYSVLAAVVIKLALDVGEAIQLVGRKDKSIRGQLTFPKLLIGSFGVESGAVVHQSGFIKHYPPRLFQVVQEEDQERIGKRKRHGSSKGGIKGVEMSSVVHAISDMVDVPTLPGLVIVGGATGRFKQRPVVFEDGVTDGPIGVINQIDETFNRAVAEAEHHVFHLVSPKMYVKELAVMYH